MTTHPPLQRVLVVEDHAPSRRLICDLLRQRSDVVIVGQAVDGLDAVRQAEALRPDVTMLDIGLPMLNGVAVAGRIREAVPDAKVIVVTNESSLDIADHAFSRGVHGYVYKPRVLRDLLRTFDRVTRGRNPAAPSHRHDVLFYSSDVALAGALGRFIVGALADQAIALVALTSAHRDGLHRHLRASHVDVDRAIRERRYISLDIEEMLAGVMVDGSPDRARMQRWLEQLVAETSSGRDGESFRIAACGECAPTLWARREVEAAIELEHLWDEITRNHEIDTLCAYPLAVREERLLAANLCAEHTAVEIG